MGEKITEVICYQYPSECPEAEEMEVLVNDEKTFVYKTNVALFATIAFEGEINVCIKTKGTVKGVVIRPLSRKIIANITENQVEFKLMENLNLAIEIEEMLPLFFFANALEKDKPSTSDEKVHYFKAGKVYNIGEFRLNGGEIIYIEGGAVVKGCLHAANVNNIKIRGHGIFDGSLYLPPAKSQCSFIIENCENVLIKDIVMIEPSAWMVVLGHCNNVEIKNLKQIGEVMCSDGIDIVGSKNVHIDGCFLRNNDDCVVIKSLNRMPNLKNVQIDWRDNVEDVLVENCVLVNAQCGNAVEIGYELQADYVRNVIFRNCDVLCVHGYGAVFSIHNGDRACISDILFENFRVEHFYDKLIDFRIIYSHYNKDNERGTVRNIHLKNINIMCSSANYGQSISIIGGYDEDHTIEDVIIEDFSYDGKRITHRDQMDLYTKCSKNIIFK